MYPISKRKLHSMRRDFLRKSARSARREARALCKLAQSNPDAAHYMTEGA